MCRAHPGAVRRQPATLRAEPREQTLRSERAHAGAARHGWALALALTALLLLVQGCGGAGAATPARSAGSSLTRVVLATGFTPSMSFAPYYLAAARGYYRRQGIDLQIQDGANAGLLEQVGRGQVDFGVSSGDSLLLAAAGGVPDVMVMQQFTSDPVGAISLASGKPIRSPAALKGLRVGVSAPNGSTYFGLLALLRAGGLTLHDVDLVSVGFTELEALSSGQVDAAMTYLDNEPVQAKAEGIPVDQLPVSRYRDLVSQGLVTSRSMIRDHPALVRRFVEATLEGLRAAHQDPAAAARAALARMPGLTPQQAARQHQILTETQRFEARQGSHPPGWLDPAAWAGTASFLREAGVLQGTVTPSRCYTNQFIGS